jgi:zinc protease
MLNFPTRLLAAAWLSAACAGSVHDPRFGGLDRDARQFSFQHNIELFEVSNGMRVALIPDDRTNLATIDVRYQVGAAEDPEGKTGLAHLVEHLAFMLRSDPGGPTIFEELGELALYYNAYTTSDETHFTSTVPIEQLERVIAIEGRRMRASCEQLDEATFERERDVVLAEEAQRADPNDEVWYEILTAVYGKGHPYARPIGSNDMATATRADACGFIAQNYAPNRAYLVITGPISPAAIRELVGKTFGPIKRHAANRRVVDPPAFTGGRSRHEADVDHPIAMVVFPRSPWGGDVMYDVAEARLAAVMSDADDDRDWIRDTGVTELGGPRAPAIAVYVEVTAEDKLDAAVDEVYARSQKLFDKLSRRGLARVIARLELGLVARWDDLGSRGGWIADFMQYTQHNRFMLAQLRALDEENWDQVSEILAGLLIAKNSHVALITPSGKKGGHSLRAAVPAGAHQQVPWRAPVDAAEADRPLTIAPAPHASVERYTLDNGLEVELARDPKSPIVDVRLVFPVGSANEPADRYGVATAAAGLLDVDEQRTYERDIVDKLEWGTSRGSNLAWNVTETTTTFSASGLAEWGDWHLWYLSWWLDQGTYTQAQLDRMHRAAKEISSDADDDEIDRASLAFGERLYGKGHPYARPAPDVGAAFLRLGARDLTAWKDQHYRASGATLVVSGRFDPAAMKQLVAALFGPWSGAPSPAMSAPPSAHPAKGPSWIGAIDEDRVQARLRIGFATASDPIEDRAARMVLAAMLQDGIREVREGMGASYGVYASYDYGAAGGALEISGDVDEAKVGEALERVLAEITAVRAGGIEQKPAFVRARRKAMATALAWQGGASSVAAQLASRAGARLPPDYDRKLAAQIAALTPAQLARVIAADLSEEHMVVMVRAKASVVDAAFAAVHATPERIE